MAFDYEAYYTEYIEKLKKKAIENNKKAFNEAYADFYKVIKKKLTEIFNKAVNDFYKDYPPLFYKRRGSLRKLLTVDIGYDYLHGEFDDTIITNRNGGSLYNQVFHEGYHGGAPSGPYHPDGSTPWYRTPHPDNLRKAKSKEGKETRPWVRWSRFSAKKADISPYDAFIKMKEEYENSPEYDGEFQKILRAKRIKYMKF